MNFANFLPVIPLASGGPRPPEAFLEQKFVLTTESEDQGISAN